MRGLFIVMQIVSCFWDLFGGVGTVMRGVCWSVKDKDKDEQRINRGSLLSWGSGTWKGFSIPRLVFTTSIYDGVASETPASRLARGSLVHNRALGIHSACVWKVCHRQSGNVWCL